MTLSLLVVKHFPACCVLLLMGCRLMAQPYFPAPGKVFTDTLIPRIDIFMDPDSLQIMYNDLYTETEYMATMVWNDGTTVDTVSNIGIRIRGNTSQVSQKKSFKIDFNEFDPGRKFYGLKELHLNGEHNDPCITRSKLYWDILRSMQVVGSRANHADLYINGNYYGLYVNVENIDDEFVDSRFGNDYGNLYKCLYPANLDYISSDPDAYKLEANGKRVYELITNTEADNYSDLAAFISMLHFTADTDFPAALEKQFDVNAFLRDYAVDVATGNWDDYAYNNNNYYLYHNPQSGKFEYISYDADNTFGIDWFNIDWGLRDIYAWNNTGLNLPLIDRILAVPEYVSRFTFFMQQLQAGMMDTANIYPEIDSILQQIAPSAELDSFRTLDYGWDYDDFLNSFTMALGGQVKYGLKPYFTARHDATASQLQSTNVIPIISNVSHFPQLVLPGDSVFIHAWIEDESVPASVQLYYQINNGAFLSTPLLDDGLHDDGAAGDQVYGAMIPALNAFDTVAFYLTATDVTAQTGREPRTGYDSITVAPVPHLVFNELMASNTTAAADNNGDYDDWLEVYNTSTFPVFLGDKFLSDEPGNTGKWHMPDVTLAAHGFQLIWCDEQGWQGDDHANFKLYAAGEQVTLYEANGTQSLLLDSISFGNQVTDVSIGCYPDGVLPLLTLSTPTPGYSNTNVSVATPERETMAVQLYPNPVSEQAELYLSVPENTGINIKIYDASGHEIFSDKENLAFGSHLLHLDAMVKKLASGLYLLMVTDESTRTTAVKKLVKQ